MADVPSQNGQHRPGDPSPDPALLLPPLPADAGRQAARTAALRRVIVGPSPGPAPVPLASVPPTPPAAVTGSPGAVRRTITPRTLGLALAVALTLIVVALVVWTVAEQSDPNYGIGALLELPDQGHTHIAPGQPHPPYNSNPATSGWHREEWAPAHVMTTTIASEVSVHLLEHGNVAIFYDCAAGGDCATLQQQLTELVQKQLAARNGDGLYLFPQALPDHHKIALASWMHLQYLDRFRADVIEQFITTFIGAVKE